MAAINITSQVLSIGSIVQEHLCSEQDRLVSGRHRNLSQFTYFNLLRFSKAKIFQWHLAFNPLLHVFPSCPLCGLAEDMNASKMLILQ